MGERWIRDMDVLTMETKDTEAEMLVEERLPSEISLQRSIYKVPKFLKDVNGDAYMPKLVSLGPYHYNRPHLRPMEQHKTRAFLLYLRRNAVSTKEVVIAMRKVKNDLMCAYGGEEVATEPSLRDEEEFLRIMIVDACFALSVILSGFTKNSIFGPRVMGFFPGDFKRDMLLMENQLPLLALYTLARFERPEEIFRRLDNIIADFFGVTIPKNIQRSYSHILDLYRMCRINQGNYLPGYKDNLQPATELSYAGISFRPSKTPSLRDVSIVGRVLRLPVLEMSNDIEPLLLNLMCYERMHPEAENEVSAYVFFMESIIHTSEDVALLRKKDIIKGWLGYDDKIVIMFKQITKEQTIVRNEVYRLDYDVNSRLNDHCKTVVTKFRANFMRTFWKDPISFCTFWLGVVIILILTLIQTIFAVLSYKQAQNGH